jgi:transposase InsO family protein
MLFVLVDAHSKWPEVYPMSSTTVANTIGVLRKIFAAYGLPEQLVSDNGPQFTSKEFATLMKGNGIQHIRSAPYHPATNGLAERFVQSVKQALKASVADGRTLSHRLSNFLLANRSTPHATTGASPSSLFLQRNLRTCLDLLKLEC